MQNKNGPFNEDKHMEAIFLELRDKFKLEYAIETGTYEGVTTEWLAKHFNHVFTVECNESFWQASQKRLAGIPNVKSYKGDSANVLRLILPQVDPAKTIIFLDAHWYTCPLIEELRVIAQSKTKPIIAIHDFKNPHHPDYGFDTYPEQGITYEWSWVEKSIKAIYGDDYSVSYNDKAEGAKRGCVFITPNPA